MATNKAHLSLKAALLALCLSTSGCAYGFIYTSTTEPLVRNMRETPTGVTHTAATDTRQISLPTTGLSAVWDSRGIGDAAKKAGLSEVYYADAHTLNILFGLYQTRTILVYGRE